MTAPPADQDPGWVPDVATILWFIGIARGDRIREPMRADARARGADLDPDSDGYWDLLADIAVQHVTFDLVEQAQECGASFSRPRS